MTTGSSYRLGIDVGGTFTDLVLVDEAGRATTRKVLSTAADGASTVTTGVRQLLAEAGVTGARVTDVLHGTTVATNMILERRGARTGLITTEGFRDVLEIGRMRLARLYDLDFARAAPLVPRRRRRTVTERLDSTGGVRVPLDLASVDRAIDDLVDQEVESVAVCLLHAYVDPVHERRVAERIAARRPDLPLSVSSAIVPEMREYERTSTTVANAYVMPGVIRYLDHLEDELAAAGIGADVQVMQSNGGIMTAAETRRRPVQIIESGPAAGVIATAMLASRMGIDDAIAMDMGGTTAKASLVENGVAHRTAEFEIGGPMSQGSRLARGSGFLIRVPAIDIAEVGAGGGSTVRVDIAGQLHVGPESAGAVPGPACYGHGGTAATLTDASVALGYLPGDRLASGLELHPALARAALQEQVAGPLGLPLLDAAHGAFVVGCARMARAVRAVTTERGRDPRASVLVAFGGNGPLFAVPMARTLGIQFVLVPPAPGVFSAVGLLDATLEHHRVRTFLRPLSADRVVELRAALDELEREAVSVLARAGRGGRVSVERSAELRYEGQGFELGVPFPAVQMPEDASAAVAALEESFGREHLRTWGHAFPGDPITVVALRVVARLDRDAPPPSRPAGDAPARPASTRDAWFGPDLGSLRTPAIARSELTATPRPGPLLVDEYDATTLVPPGATASLDDQGNIRVSTGVMP